ncbi:GatB/YqeY domain-containing protein [Allopusillimonas soli]|uniref:GatB/YqeY domain-containing protein n=1 Tax=Allopusillimonas soli TaxID=659016 RepID=A0A853FAM0_9BURK|nr:GatB/YqeY domain-containing protein [Allopusillimonas soli]NYT36828.1 GatB/YqeY domain-containing protein [Allopusillimonas soli]TEA75290.1 GatB/YqeY domain-containing protein [Allopusillimonas soli]
MGTSLTQQISEAVKDAMRARDTARLGTLRFLQAAIKQKEVDSRQTLSDTEVTAIIEKQVKQRRESIAAFQQAGRTETAAQEQAELAVLQEFLPQAATAEEVEAAITVAIDQVKAQGLSGGPAMGKIMGLLKAGLAGRADMAAVSAQVKARLM